MDKNININILAEGIDPENTTRIDFNGNGIDIKRTVGFADASRFVEMVADMCFNDAGEYLPQVYSVAVSYALLSVFTSVDDPTNITALYDAIYRSDLIVKIKEYIDESQLKSLLDAVDEKIEYKIQANISAAQKHATEIMSKLDAASKTLEQVSSWLGDADIAALISAIVNGKIDEKKLMEAYLGIKEGA